MALTYFRERLFFFPFRISSDLTEFRVSIARISSDLTEFRVSIAAAYMDSIGQLMRFVGLKYCLQWGIVDTEIMVSSVVNPELTNAPLKPGVGQNIAMHASPTARNFSLVLISASPVHSPSFFTCHPHG